MSTQVSWSKTLTALGLSDPIPVDLRRFKFGCGIIITMTGTGTYDVQVTGDQGPYANWNKHDLLQGLTASKNGNLAYPVTAIRLNATALTGTLTMSLVQPIG